MNVYVKLEIYSKSWKKELNVVDRDINESVCSDQQEELTVARIEFGKLVIVRANERQDSRCQHNRQSDRSGVQTEGNQ